MSNFFINVRRVLSCYHYIFLEFLAVNTKIFYNILMGWRGHAFKNDVKMAKVNSGDKVLQIGCGIFPTEAIIIAQETGAKVVGIDNAPASVKHATRFVEKKNLSNLITIKYADGIDFSVKDFNVVFVAINVFPINGVLNHLSKTLKKGCRIMCKSMKHDIPKVLKKEDLNNVFEIVDELKNHNNQSYLLVKKQ